MKKWGLSSFTITMSKEEKGISKCMLCVTWEKGMHNWTIFGNSISMFSRHHVWNYKAVGSNASPNKNVQCYFWLVGGGEGVVSIIAKYAISYGTILLTPFKVFYLSLTSCVFSSDGESRWRRLSWTRMKSPRRNWNFRSKTRNCCWKTSDASVFWACNKIFVLVKTRHGGNIKKSQIK